MTLELMEALFQRNIPQTHYVILTYPTITPEVLLQTAENIHAVLKKYQPLLAINLGPFLWAHESNGLMGMVESPQIIRSAEGKEKRLPAALRLKDRQLEKHLEAVLLSPLPPYMQEVDTTEIDKAIAETKDPQERKILEMARRKQLQFLLEGKKIYEGLNWSSPVINYYAAHWMLVRLKERLA